MEEAALLVPVVALGCVAGLTKVQAREIAVLIDETLVELFADHASAGML